MAPNTLARTVQAWVERSWPTWTKHIQRRKDGEFEVAFPAPRGSKAGHLRIFTSQGNLWVRYNPPRMCYPIDNRAELLSIGRQLLNDKVFFVNTYRGEKWTGCTLTRRGVEVQVQRGEVAQVVSWSGKFDAPLGEPKARSNNRAG